jgi:hypothetical protein
MGFSIEDTPEVIKGSEGLLSQAMRLLNKYVYSVSSDGVGMVSFEVDDAIVVAKKYAVMEMTVSAHKNAILEALEKKKRLLMYIDSLKTFYYFNPQTLLEKGVVNLRGKSEMINFDYHLGTLT